MRDYYVIQRLAESPPAGLLPGDDPRSGATEFFTDDVVVDFPSLQNAVARIRASVGMWELDGLWVSDVPLSSTDVVE